MTKIAIIGGSYLQLPAVLSAQKMGFEVHCFSWKEGAICADYADYFYPISILENEEILKVCKKVQIDGILTISSDVAVITVNYVADKMGLISNPASYSYITTNKYKMRECFREHNIPSPQYALVDSTLQFDIDGFLFPLIVKPTDRSGSRGVEKIMDITELQDAVKRAVSESFTQEAIIEEYVSGREISIESISYQGKHYILQITDKVTTGAPYFVELEHHQPSTLPLIIQEQVKDIVLRALDALHVRYGASHSELKITEDGDIRVIEIGARMGGDFIGSTLVPLSTGYDYLKGVIKIAMGEFVEPQITQHNYSGVYFLCKETEHLKTIIDNKVDYPEIIEAEITDPTLRNIECSGDRSGYFIYKSNTKFVK